MAQNYTVNYTINVQTNGALGAMRRFSNATKALTNAAKNFQKLTQSVNSLSNNLGKLQAKTYTVNIDTTQAHKKVNSLSRRLSQLKKQLQQLRAMGLSLGSVGGGGSGSSGKGTNTALFGGRGKTSRAPIRRGGSLSYKALGPTPMDVGGIGAINFLKGMGIAYGIAGVGSLVSNMIKDAVAYDNSMQTVRNILYSHDAHKDSFGARFKGMEQTVRNVGVETKFTAPQVADAAKFLAMAGFDINEINNSIRPIADIALIGDTDLGETADVVTNIMTGYNIKSDQVRRAADIMTNTFTMSNTTLMEIAEAYKYSASLLNAGGIDFEEATAALGILGNAGIKGSQAGTTLRTLMANIVNPSKKQLANWERVGVKRFDENGKIRNLVDIFGDLSNAGLYVDDFYKLFHKTAAQGAVALTNNVAEWNNIIKENFLSDGMSEELADAKKNTIQGLWAQLTSAFTENGLKAFEGIQSPIKGILNDAINWLKTPEAANVIASFTHDIMSFIIMIKDATIWIFKLMKAFKPFIEFWLKFQIYMWPVLTVLRVFKAAWLGMQAIGKGTMWLLTLNSRLRMLSATMSTVGGRAALFRSAMIPLATQMNTPIMLPGRKRPVSPEVLARYHQMHPYSVPMGGATSWGGVVGGLAKGAIGGAAFGYLGSQIGEAIGGSNGSMWGGMAGGILGMAFPFLVSNPIGWGVTIAAAIGAITVAYFNQKSAIDAAVEANKKYLSSMAAVGGINYGENASTADKYYALIYNRQIDINHAIGEHIRLVKEQLGIMDTLADNVGDTTKFKDSQHKTNFDNANKIFGYWSDRDDWITAAAPVVDINGNTDPLLSPRLQEFLDANGSSYSRYTFNGYEYADTKGGYSTLAAAKYLTALGADMSEGSDTQKYVANNMSQILKTATLADFKAITDNIWAEMNAKTWIPGSESWTMDQLGNSTGNQYKNSYHYLYGQKARVFSQFQWNNPQTQRAKQLADLYQIISSYESGADPAQELLESYLANAGILIFDKNQKGYKPYGSAEMLEQYGWYNNQWNQVTVPMKKWNEVTQQWEESQVTLTAEQAQQHFLTFHAEIVKAVNELSPMIRPYFQSFLTNPMWNLGNNLGQGVSHRTGDKITLDSGTWTWDGNQWVSEHSVLLPMDDATMQREVAKMQGNGQDNKTPTTAPTYTPKGTGGQHPSDYKTHYDNSAATPKQIIVNIDKLMSVDKVDLADPNKAQAIAEFKAEFVPVILDVLHNAENYM